jgi:hypothetical protein
MLGPCIRAAGTPPLQNFGIIYSHLDSGYLCIVDVPFAIDYEIFLVVTAMGPKEILAKSLY